MTKNTLINKTHLMNFNTLILYIYIYGQLLEQAFLFCIFKDIAFIYKSEEANTDTFYTVGLSRTLVMFYLCHESSV